MRKPLIYAIVFALTLAAFAVFCGRQRSEAEEEKRPMLCHDVYFALKDNSAAKKKKLLDACTKNLSKHPGEVFFAVGTIAEDLNREVNDRDFDVSLHLVFKDKADHDKYQDSERHKQFIDENKDNWKKVRVFDSVLSR